MQRFSLSFIALCLFVVVLASALPAQNKRSGPGDEAFHMVNEIMSDPAFQTGGGIGQETVITPTNGSGSKPTPAPSSTAAAYGPVGAAPSSTPVASHLAKPSHTPSPTKTAVPTATPTPTGGKDKGSFLSKIPLLGKLLGGK